MRGVWLCILLVGAFLAVSAQDAAQEKPPELVFYDQRDDGALTWGDFQGSVPQGEELAEVAEILWGITFTSWDNVTRRGEGTCSVTPKPGTLNFRAFMVPKKSWVKPGKKSDVLLAHEQGHFDIAHIYAKKLQAAADALIREGKLRGRGKTCKEAQDALQRQIENLFKKFYDKCAEIQDLYDKVMKHGTDPVKQATWKGKIRGWLAKPGDAPDP